MSAPGSRTRPAAVAGRFYPGDPARLRDTVCRLLDSIEPPADESLAPAYVVPHAGYQFSGPVAAHVYARLRRHADQIRRVVLLGPAHYVRLRGCAVPETSTWTTPLGPLAVDTAACRMLTRDGHAVADDTPHAPEHSLEVQVPFLQQALGDGWSLLPIAVGVSSVDDVVVTLAAAVEAAPEGTVVLCSTDLSHYQDQATAQKLDERTARAVLDLAPERIGLRDACGVFALRGTVGWARHGDLAPDLLDLRTSADTAGDPSRVVGYSAFAFSAGRA